jgi:hypothetical protein
MAGTLLFRLKVEHVYQRRFDSESLAEALTASHWYIISRRPSVGILEDSVRLDDQILTADFVTRDDLAGAEQIHTLGSDFCQFGPLHDFRIYADGAYFSVSVGDSLLHGDAWALASLLSGARADIARQEVLYVGQAFGDHGAGNTWQRTQQHEKLQRIYEDHVNTDSEIFVAPLSVERSSFRTDDHIDDKESGIDLFAYWETFANQAGHILKTSVDLIEHSLIAYFVPPYNEKLTEWCASKPTIPMQKMRSVGFRLLQVHLSGWEGLARFYSMQEPNLIRSHFISHDIPPSPRRSVKRGIAAETLSRWTMGGRLAREGKEIFAERSERADIALRAFGDLAPTIRKPTDVTLPVPRASASKQPVDAAAHEEIRASIHIAREEERKLHEPIQHSGESSYDPSNGTISIGQDRNGASVSMLLHEPGAGVIHSALILGKPQSGKSNTLRVIMLEAYLSGKFLIVPLDPLGKNEFLETWHQITDDQLIATDLDGAIRSLTTIRGIIEKRLAAERPETYPGILVGIDDADIVLQHSLGARLITDILERGGEAGVGLVLVVSDISAVENDADLMYELVSCHTKAVLLPDTHFVIDDLVARHGKRRSSTWRDDTLSFVLHRGAGTTTIGLLAGITGSDATPAEAQAWCELEFARHGVMLSNWQAVHGEPWSWWTMQPLAARFWFLRKHHDEWALTQTISRVPTSMFESTADMLKWASEVISARFTVDLEPWQMGPTTPEKDSITLYADVSGDIIVKDTTKLVEEALLNRY